MKKSPLEIENEAWTVIFGHLKNVLKVPHPGLADELWQSIDQDRLNADPKVDPDLLTRIRELLDQPLEQK